MTPSQLMVTLWPCLARPSQARSRETSGTLGEGNSSGVSLTKPVLSPLMQAWLHQTNTLVGREPGQASLQHCSILHPILGTEIGKGLGPSAPPWGLRSLFSPNLQ